ncbi:MAG TPA: glycosyltransferase [Acidimicrobiia bacterium]|nr:glycosyltransferase [Acidimicrobiia bacterium]
MTVIDLTDGGAETRHPRVGMVTRFPPSSGGSASSALEMAARLMEEHGLSVEVLRLMGHGEDSSTGHPVVMDVNPRWRMGAELVARRANRCDVVIAQIDRHVPIELADDLVSKLEVPLILLVDDIGNGDQTPRLAALAQKAAVVVVPSESARRRLLEAMDDGADIRVTPHGSIWTPLAPRQGKRRNILTWGFIEPGAGVERIIRAMAMLSDLDPRPRYRVVGVADPAWPSREAAAYRRGLKALAEELGIADQVDLVPIVHSREGLRREIERCDLVAVPYDTGEATCSRILTEAVSTGRPVVATGFPGAIEMLSLGSGLTVAHDDDTEMASALRLYLTDDAVYRRAADIAAVQAGGFAWEEVARSLAQVVGDVLGARALPAESTAGDPGNARTWGPSSTE